MFDKDKPCEHELAPELVALERQLRDFVPSPPGIDRDRLMFAAGKAASMSPVAEPGQNHRAIYIVGPSWAARHFWPAATVTMTAATLLLATMLVWQNRSPSVVQLSVKPQAAVKVVNPTRDTDDNQADRFASRDAWSTFPPTTNGYLGIRYIALTRGINALPPEVSSADGGRETPTDNERTNPATARGLLDELLPAPNRSIQSRS